MIISHISGRDLKRVVTNVGRFIPRNSYHSQHINIAQENGRLYFHDDSNTYIEYIEAATDNEGAIAVDFKDFTAFVKACKAGDSINLIQANSTDGPTLVTATDSLRKVFSGKIDKDYKLPWEFREDKDYYWVALKEMELFNALAGANVHYERNGNRPILGTINFEFKEDEYKITACDGFRLIHYFGDCPGKEEFEFKVEGSAITNMLKTIKPKDNEYCSIIVKDNYIIFGMNNSQCRMDNVPGNYPEYMNVFPKMEGERAWGFDIDADLLKQAIDQATAYEVINQENVRIWRDTGKLRVSRGTQENYQDVAVEVKPDNIYNTGKIYMNAKYLKEMLAQCHGQASVRFGGPGMDAERTAVQFYQPNFMGIIMPVFIDKPEKVW